VWSGASNAATYSVRVFEDQGGSPAEDPVVSAFDIVGTVWAIPSGTLTKGRSYWIEVIAWGSNGVSPPKEALNGPVRFLYSSLHPFSLFSPVNPTSGVSLRPTFTWQSVSGASGYRFEILGIDELNTGFQFQKVIPGAAYDFDGPTLSNGMLYKWTVYAQSVGEELQSFGVLLYSWMCRRSIFMRRPRRNRRVRSPCSLAAILWQYLRQRDRGLKQRVDLKPGASSWPALPANSTSHQYDGVFDLERQTYCRG
jgi:hypothetical protein